MRLPGLRPAGRVALLVVLAGGLLAAFGVGEPAAAQEHGASGHGSGPIGALLVGLCVVLVGAKLAGELLERAKQPAVAGEIALGIVLGNLGLLGFHGLAFLRQDAILAALGELGVIILLFEVGLESNVQEMRRVGLSSLLVAVLGVVAPMAFGFLVSSFFLPDHPVWTHVFAGATLCATSVGITARVLRDLGQTQRPESRIILGAAVIDDVLGLVVLAVVSALIRSAGSGAEVGFGELAAILLKSLGFLVGAIYLGGRIAPLLFRVASFLNVQHMLLVSSLGFCFVLAWLASLIDLAPIVGAFAAGLVLDPVVYRDFQDRGEQHVEDLIRPISAFLTPIFFVVTGMKVDLGVLADPAILGFALVLTLAAVAGKQVCALGVTERGLNRLAVGVGMIPRGEVGLIFANIGLGLTVVGAGGAPEPVVGRAAFGAVVVMVMATTLMTPSLLKWSFAREKAKPVGRTA